MPSMARCDHIRVVLCNRLEWKQQPVQVPVPSPGAGHRWLAAPVIPSAWAHVEEGGAKKKTSPSDHLRTQQSFSPLITREPIFSSHLVPSRPARPLPDGGWRRLGTALPSLAWPQGVPVASQRTGPPPHRPLSPELPRLPGPEGSPTSPAKARHVTETGLVGHTANKHQPRDGVIPLGKVLSRPSPSGFCCCMALQRLHTRGRSEGKAACLGRSGTHAVMAELALGPGDRRGPTRATTSRCLPKTEAAGRQMTKVGGPFSKGQKPDCLCIPMEPRRPGVWGAGMVPLGDGAGRRSRFSGAMKSATKAWWPGLGPGLGARRSAMFNSPERYPPSYRCLDPDDTG